MAEDEPLTAAESGERAGDGTLLGDVRALVDDGRNLLEAELAFRKAQLAYAVARSKGIAGLLVLSLFFAFFALMALVVGLLIGLTPLLTAWGATALVTLVLLALAGLCALAGLRRIKTMQARLSGKDVK